MVVEVTEIARVVTYWMTDRVGSTDLLEEERESDSVKISFLLYPRDDRNGVTIVAGATITP